jgi:hypothetical protein
MSLLSYLCKMKFKTAMHLNVNKIRHYSLCSHVTSISEEQIFHISEMIKKFF